MKRPLAWPAKILLIAAAAMFVESTRRVIVRLEFHYDLLLWADDFFFTSMQKLAAGLPLYTGFEDANSTMYPPGGAWLHSALLAPFSLAASLQANRILNLVWFFFMGALGTGFVAEAARGEGTSPASLPARAVLVTLAGGVVFLAAFANPTADSLHPTNLEGMVLAATALVLLRFDKLAPGAQLAALALLPAAGLLVKQAAGVAAALALTGNLVVARSPGRALVPLSSAALTAAVVFTTVPHSYEWTVEVLSRQPFEWWKITDLYRGYFLLFAPAVVTVVLRTVTALRRRDASDRAFLRAASLGAVYTPLALASLFKVLGGPNNLGVVGWLAVLLALPSWLAACARPTATHLAVFAVQIALLYPRRYVPNDRDHASARRICDYAAARLRCGEHVLLGRGSVCYQRAGAPPPLDRVNSILEVAEAGRASELGVTGRLRRGEYDVVILSSYDFVRLGKVIGSIVREHYRPFHTTTGGVEGDFWFHGFAGYATVPNVFWERVEDAGKHAVSEVGMRCDTGGAE